MDSLNRRSFAKAGLAAALATQAVGARPLEPLSAGIKISMQVDEKVTPEDLTWMKQMGVEYLNVQTGEGPGHAREFSGYQEAR